MITDNVDVSQANGQARPVYRNRQGYTDDSDISIIALGVPAQQGESLIEIARKIIEALGEEVSSNVTITKAFRFRSRYNDWPPPMKITFRKLNEKILVLRNKMNLKDTNDYAKVYLKGCKNHAERLIEINARTLLRQLPDGRKFRVDANGRIQQHEQHQHLQSQNNDR